MTLEVLNAVRKAEKEAEAIRQQGAADAKETIRKAEAELKDDTEKKLHALRHRAMKTVNQAEEEANSEYEKDKQEKSRQRERLKSEAMNRMDEAVAYIVGKVL